MQKHKYPNNSKLKIIATNEQLLEHCGIPMYADISGKTFVFSLDHMDWNDGQKNYTITTGNNGYSAGFVVPEKFLELFNENK